MQNTDIKSWKLSALDLNCTLPVTLPKPRGVDYHMPARQWHVEMTYLVNMFTGPAGMFIFRRSTTVQAGLHTLKSDTSKL